MNNLKFRSIDVLIVEDNPGDARLILEVLKSNLVYNSIHTVKDGVEAMDFLHKNGKFSMMPRPDLIFLDLNLPRKDGRQVLAEIKSDERFKQIPVVVLSMSAADEDIMKSYKLHANCYVTKPIDLDQFIQDIESIEQFWFSLVRLPSKAYRTTSG
jgi:two-component system, chemotaxis family, response regulator Rcp1